MNNAHQNHFHLILNFTLHAGSPSEGNHKAKPDKKGREEEEEEGVRPVIREIPQYTTVVKLKKPPKGSSDETKSYDKLKHQLEAPDHALSPQSPNPGSGPQRGYSFLNSLAVKGGKDDSSPPPLPPPISADNLSALELGDTGEAVYYNEAAAVLASTNRDEGRTGEETCEDVQYANC